MRIKSNVKAGSCGGCTYSNHNQTVRCLRVKSNITAGSCGGCTFSNHNQTVKGLRVKSNIKAGRLAANHNQTVAR
jgi:hypothetical protein